MFIPRTFQAWAARGSMAPDTLPDVQPRPFGMVTDFFEGRGDATERPDQRWPLLWTTVQPSNDLFSFPAPYQTKGLVARFKQLGLPPYHSFIAATERYLLENGYHPHLEEGSRDHMRIMTDIVTQRQIHSRFRSYLSDVKISDVKISDVKISDVKIYVSFSGDQFSPTEVFKNSFSSNGDVFAELGLKAIEVFECVRTPSERIFLQRIYILMSRFLAAGRDNIPPTYRWIHRYYESIVEQLNQVFILSLYYDDNALVAFEAGLTLQRDFPEQWDEQGVSFLTTRQSQVPGWMDPNAYYRMQTDHRKVSAESFAIIRALGTRQPMGEVSLLQTHPIHSLADYNPNPLEQNPIKEQKMTRLRALIDQWGLDREKVLNEFLKGVQPMGVVTFSGIPRSYLIQGHHRAAALIEMVKQGEIPASWLERVPVELYEGGSLPVSQQEFLAYFLSHEGFLMNWSDIL